jgi:hypothetical protein
MSFGIHRFFFSFLGFLLLLVNRADDRASCCITPSLLLSFFTLWINVHDLLLQD